MLMNSEQDLLLALATSPNFKNDTLVFAGRQSGLYRSHDSGKTWEKVQVVAGEALSVTALAISSKLLWAALPGGVAYSVDLGSSWSWTQFATPAPYITALAVSPQVAEDKNLFAATLEDGVFRSVNGGATWESWNFGLLDKQVLCLALKGESVYAGTGTGLFHSRTGARSWREVTLPVEDAVLSLTVMGGRLLVGTEKHGLFTSANEGVSWKRKKARGLNAPINQIQVVAGKEASVHVLAGEALWESLDEGKSWRQVRLPQFGAAPTQLALPLVGFADGRVSEYLGN
jgi:photosystem II stability/assembly factor-like uncharacterized protein